MLIKYSNKTIYFFLLNIRRKIVSYNSIENAYIYTKNAYFLFLIDKFLLYTDVICRIDPYNFSFFNSCLLTAKIYKDNMKVFTKFPAKTFY